MAVKIRIPTPLQKLTKNQAEISCEAETILQMIHELEKQYPGFKDRICDSEGRLRRFVNIYVNDEDIRFLQNEKTLLKAGDEVSIIPAIAGGGHQ